MSKISKQHEDALMSILQRKYLNNVPNEVAREWVKDLSTDEQNFHPIDVKEGLDVMAKFDQFPSLAAWRTYSISAQNRRVQRERTAERVDLERKQLNAPQVRWPSAVEYCYKKLGMKFFLIAAELGHTSQEEIKEYAEKMRTEFSK